MPIKQALAYCFALTGLKEENYPKDVAESVLIDFIMGAYGGYAAEEIKIAFKLACAGKVEVETNHFQNFNAEYLGRILKAYDERRRKELSQTMGTTKKTLTKHPIDRLKHYEDKLFKPFEKLLKGEYAFTDIDEHFLYRSLDKMGITLATLDQKKESMVQAEEEEPKPYRQNPDERLRKVKNRAMRICFRNWIEDCALNDINLRELVTKKIQ